MEGDGSARMDRAAVAAFVGRGGTGVLALAAEDVPYAAPVSYGFDPEAESFYLRLGFGEDSEKRAFVTDDGPARLVIYGEGSDGWTSVMAVGPLHRVTDAELTPEIARTLGAADLPVFDLWDEAVESIDFQIYRLAPDRLTGRSTATHESA